MLRRLLLVAAVVVVVGGLLAATLASRSRLERDRDAATSGWTPLRAPLDARYRSVGALAGAVGAAGAASQDAVRATEADLRSWNAAARGPVTAQVAAANALEGDATRLGAVVAASPRLQGDATVSGALRAIGPTQPPVAATGTFNEAVRRYERTRNGAWAGIVASTLHFGSLPTFQTPTPA